MKVDSTIQREQFRQAKFIHGGLFKMGAAYLGIRLSRLPIPTERLRLWLYREVFGKRYPPGVNEDEAEKPLSAYSSLNQFFTRGLKPECRPILSGTSDFICPCDGTVQDVGRVEDGKILTVKGVEYTLASLLPRTDLSDIEGGHFVIIFLSPIDCHRVFSPQDGSIDEVIHVPGSRLLVHPPCQRPEYPVYTLNERVILRFSNSMGPCVLVCVAGWGVGNITLPIIPSFRTGSKRVSLALPIRVKRGDWVATFELGSTVVLFAPPSSSAVSLVSPGEKVKYGQPLIGYS